MEPRTARCITLASSNGTWTGSDADINETTANDANFLASPTSPPSGTYVEVTLGDLAAPAELSTVAVHYRAAKSAAGGETIDLTVELRQGTTVIASETTTDVAVQVAGFANAAATTLTPRQRRASSCGSGPTGDPTAHPHLGSRAGCSWATRSGQWSPAEAPS